MFFLNESSLPFLQGKCGVEHRVTKKQVIVFCFLRPDEPIVEIAKQGNGEFEGVLNKDLQEIESLKNELSRTKLQLEEANRSLDVYRNSANLGIR